MKWSRLRPVWVPALAAGVLAVAAVVWWTNRPGDIVIGAPPDALRVAAAGPTVPDRWATTTTSEVAPPHVAAGGGGGPTHGGTAHVVAFPDGSPYGPALPFTPGVAVPDDLVFVLVVGSDARPGEDPLRSRADSIHLAALNPVLGVGTLIGIPRDSWVDIPGRGRGKINSALSRGGPDLLAETVRNLTGLPIHYWVVTGFSGYQAMIDALGGVDVPVETRITDRYSGAYFEAGWHRFSGGEALAYSRTRKTLPGGDFDRSSNQGRVLVSALAKLRAEVGDMSGLDRWLGILVNHARIEVGAADLRVLATAARLTDPARILNVVVPGRVGSAGGQSVVFLTQGAVDMFTDVRDDAYLGPPPPPPTTTTTAAPTTTAPPTTSPPTTSASTTSTPSLLPIG